jgi:hypothetical protein
MMDIFSQILQRMSKTTYASSSSGNFGGVAPFKVQINFDIPTFGGKNTFALLKVVPHVKYWWETYCEQKSIEESGIFGVELTWESFMDVVKEQYYPIGNYDDRYMRWTTMHQDWDKIVSEFTNIFHNLCTKLGIRDSEQHLVLKYHGGIHKYIQT